MKLPVQIDLGILTYNRTIAPQLHPFFNTIRPIEIGRHFAAKIMQVITEFRSQSTIYTGQVSFRWSNGKVPKSKR